MANKKNVFMLIREAKVETAKKIFQNFGGNEVKMADILTPDELVKAFDFFAGCAEFTDDEGMDDVNLDAFSTACMDQTLLSPESILRIKEEVQEDFFPEA